MNPLKEQPDDHRSDEAVPQGERHLPEREPGTMPKGEPGNTWATPEEDRPPQREEGTVSDPDFPLPFPGASPGV